MKRSRYKEYKRYREEKIYPIIRNVWFGKEKLWKVFWLYKILLGTLFSVALESKIKGEYIKELSEGIYSVIFLPLFIVFNVWVLKGLYACRYNLNNKTGYIPKIIPFFIAVNVIFLTFSIVMYFAVLGGFIILPVKI